MDWRLETYVVRNTGQRAHPAAVEVMFWRRTTQTVSTWNYGNVTE